jgi:phage nucleotide-binding protein
MKLYNTAQPQQKPSIVMMVYGEGGVGKTTFAATAPNPIMADCENGAKYLGLRGISMDVAVIENWTDFVEFWNAVKNSKYETIVIDPIGELMDKLKRTMIAQGDSKLVQKDGSPTTAGWGWLKKTLRDALKAIRDTGKNVVIVAHVEEKQDDQRLVKRPKVETKLSDELVNMVDIVAYMTVINDPEKGEARVLIVDPGSDRYTAKDRTGTLGKYLKPDFKVIENTIFSAAKWAEAPKAEAMKAPEQPKEVSAGVNQAREAMNNIINTKKNGKAGN